MIRRIDGKFVKLSHYKEGEFIEFTENSWNWLCKEVKISRWIDGKFVKVAKIKRGIFLNHWIHGKIIEKNFVNGCLDIVQITRFQYNVVLEFDVGYPVSHVRPTSKLFYFYMCTCMLSETKVYSDSVPLLQKFSKSSKTTDRYLWKSFLQLYAKSRYSKQA